MNTVFRDTIAQRITDADKVYEADIAVANEMYADAVAEAQRNHHRLVHDALNDCCEHTTPEDRSA